MRVSIFSFGWWNCLLGSVVRSVNAVVLGCLMGKNIIFDYRWINSHGIGRFAKELNQRLAVKPIALDGKPTSPLDPFRLAAYFRNIREGVFLSPGYNAPFFSSIPYVLTVHDINHIDVPHNSSFFKRLYYAWILKRLVHRAACVLTVSVFSKSRIEQYFHLASHKVVSVGNGVSQDFLNSSAEISPGQADYGRYLLCVSNRKGHKNETKLLQAFATAAVESNLKLVLTGESTAELLELANSLNIAERIAFAGRVSEQELVVLYTKAIALVFPSLYEGFGLPIVEAFACGTPVLTSNVTSMPEIAGDAAVLVDPKSVESIAEGIGRIVNDQVLRETLRERGFERAKIFTWDKVAEKVQAVLDTIS